ncbi:phenylacetate-CoA ligase [Lipingzhangella halophila]|uniref:Phenylacetate-CoA ligase n=1 Tax=Lipingzhangella halophila TaxID=1783352 RepID=A0A7W7W553_9ACTN|nr:phenylacetate--CoA ligase family protein [Lipingzhangella halophila]MBB4934887.1 phenylacetate-CoA ligase [Lipingzhangella halophila]
MDADRPDLVVAALREFFSTRPPAPDDPEAHVVDLFHRVADSVPAYRHFLRANNVDPDTVRSFTDFRQLPLLSKENYHRRYPLPQLCRDGRMDGCDMVAVSSGSTGQPTFWPRFLTDELSVATQFERVFADSFAADQRSTLAVVCFPLGTWVGGLYTTACVRHLAAKGYPVTVVAPGNNKAEILRVIPELGPHVDQVVLLGYPPFVKDVIDSGPAAGVEWARYSLKLVLAGEVFSEEWRALVGQRSGMTDPDHDSAALYGTADAGVLGHETPLSVRVRRFLAANPGAARELFGESRLPTLVQYDPTHRYFETHEGTLLFSGDNGVPLIRYHIADEGGLVSYGDMLAFCARHGLDLGPDEVGSARRLPFAYVFGRSQFTVSYFGANIYPENVTVGLEQAEVSAWVTGKFVLETAEDADSDRQLRLVVELAPGEEPTVDRQRTVAESVRDQLLRLNSEFANYVPPERQLPHTALLPAGDPEYFPVGVKHRYTRPSGTRSS